MGAAFGNMPFIGLLSTASGSGYGDPVPSSPAAAGTPIPRISAFRKTDGIHDEEQEKLILCWPRQYPWDKAPQKVTVPQRPVLHKGSARTGKASGAHGERREIS